MKEAGLSLREIALESHNQVKIAFLDSWPYEILSNAPRQKTLIGWEHLNVRFPEAGFISTLRLWGFILTVRIFESHWRLNKRLSDANGVTIDSTGSMNGRGSSSTTSPGSVCDNQLDVCVWEDRERNQRCHTGLTPGVCIWGAICTGSRRSLGFIPEALNVRRYIDHVLELVLLPYLEEVQDGIFQEDNA